MGPCAVCGREHVRGKWWPRHPFKPQLRVVTEVARPLRSGLTVGQLRAALGGLRGDLPVLVAGAASSAWAVTDASCLVLLVGGGDALLLDVGDPVDVEGGT